MTELEQSTDTVSFIGGWLCLDFINTINWCDSDKPNDRIQSYPDLLVWSQQADILTGHEAQQLLEEAKLHPQKAELTFMRAIALRETLFRVFSAIVDHDTPDARDLAAFNKELREAMTLLQIRPTKTGYTMGYQGEEKALDRILWVITRSAANLLTSDKLSRIKKCAAPDCAWMFLDMSRNRSRRWCAMNDCGNREKARRYYKRKTA
ncbi:MAG: CGNR zinc finger domain-containing protein [Promethearchaeota archaeon]